MPTYVYKCPYCGHTAERYEKLEQEKHIPNPTCQHHELRVEMLRVPATFAFNFKGGKPT